MKPRRADLARLGKILVRGSVPVVIAMCSCTCTLGGFHCFDGGAGHAVAVAQIGVLFGLLCICSVLGSVDLFCRLRLPNLPSVALSFSCIDRSLSQRRCLRYRPKEDT